MPRLLFEIGTEELPAWYVTEGSEALEAAVVALLADAHLSHGAVERFATPRRLAVLVHDVAAASERRMEYRRGPPAKAAYGDDGQLSKAGLAFANSFGVAPEELKVQEGEKGSYLYAERWVGGEDARTLLAPRLSAVVAELPAPRKMRWGDVDTAFVRPVAWLVALWDAEVLPVEAAGLTAGRSSRGHRFLHTRPVELSDAADYRAALRAAQVLADRAERAEAVRTEVAAAAEGKGLHTDPPQALIEEIVDLVERPFAVLGAFEEAYLELPEEVLTTVMIHHQRFVPVRDSDGRLAPGFVAVSNNRVADVALVRSGYEQVLGGRLYDARFFWDADRRQSLSQHAWRLAGMAFQRELGSMADKMARVAVGAKAIAEVLGVSEGESAALARALPVFRADLATEMVGELPELEGTMAKAYALADGYPPEVAQALEDGVRPKAPEDQLPASRIGAVLAVADRLDKLLGFFAIGKRPSGSADPFALRRDAVALLRVLSAQGWRLPLARLIEAAAEAYQGGAVEVDEAATEGVEDFLWDRVAGLLAEEGIGTQVQRAAIQGSRSVVAAARRAHLLKALSGLEAFADLQALYKRAANLGEKATPGVEPTAELFSEEAEAPLFAALAPARQGVAELLAAVRAQLGAWDLGAGPEGEIEGLEELAAEVLQLKAPLDAFLDGVLVMVEDDKVRENRLALLAAVAGTLRELGALELL